MRTLGYGMLAALALAGASGAAAEPKNVAITAIVEHPALDAVRDGVKKGLADLGYAEGTDVTFAYESAQGNPATAAQIARQFVGDAPAVIVAISTPSAQAVGGGDQGHPDRLLGGDRPGRGGARRLDRGARRQRHRRLRHGADRRPRGADQGDHAQREAARRALQSGRGELRLLGRRC